VYGQRDASTTRRRGLHLRLSAADAYNKNGVAPSRSNSRRRPNTGRGVVKLRSSRATWRRSPRSKFVLGRHPRTPSRETTSPASSRSTRGVRHEDRGSVTVQVKRGRWAPGVHPGQGTLHPSLECEHRTRRERALFAPSRAADGSAVRFRFAKNGNSARADGAVWVTDVLRAHGQDLPEVPGPGSRARGAAGISRSLVREWGLRGRPEPRTSDVRSSSPAAPVGELVCLAAALVIVILVVAAVWSVAPEPSGERNLLESSASLMVEAGVLCEGWLVDPARPRSHSWPSGS